MNDNVTKIHSGVVTKDNRSREQAISDLEQLLAELKSGEVEYDYGVFVYVKPDLSATWFRLGECTLVEGIGLMHIVAHDMREHG